MKKIYVDPPGCGCTGCITGESTPLDDLSDIQAMNVYVGHLELVNRTSYNFVHITLSPNMVTVVGSDDATPQTKSFS